ncbi:MAG: hypothetical protein Q8P81_02260 [Nanoarchaeota archaeon]|nr:hypothetical protein [Nanoarchaeota archaeon]
MRKVEDKGIIKSLRKITDEVCVGDLVSFYYFGAKKIMDPYVFKGLGIVVNFYQKNKKELVIEVIDIKTGEKLSIVNGFFSIESRAKKHEKV